jgi:hypothetical protein
MKATKITKPSSAPFTYTPVCVTSAQGAVSPKYPRPVAKEIAANSLASAFKQDSLLCMQRHLAGQQMGIEFPDAGPRIKVGLHSFTLRQLHALGAFEDALSRWAGKRLNLAKDTLVLQSIQLRLEWMRLLHLQSDLVTYTPSLIYFITQLGVVRTLDVMRGVASLPLPKGVTPEVQFLRVAHDLIDGRRVSA